MAGPAHKNRNDQFVDAREQLIREIKAQVKKFGTGDGDTELIPDVLDVLRRVPREQFVPMMELADAYANAPLPIGHRQTISQPLIVALMTHHLRLEPYHRVLEIGTGSGYQTAVLAEIASDIVTIENLPPLAEAAKITLTSLGYSDIHFIEGDGRSGAPDHAPFDRIIVTAAAETLPDSLIEQLTPNGRLVAPIGQKGKQQMIVLEKSTEGQFCQQVLFPVVFVPLT